jgi:hypothetical protein
MAKTYKLISSSTVGSGGAANIEFTSIPSTYTDLVLKLSVRNDWNLASYQYVFTVNNSATGYNRRFLYGDGVGTDSNTATGETSSRFSFEQSTAYTANTFANIEMYFSDYANTSTYKSQISNYANENNATSCYSVGMHNNTWHSTAAITSIKIQPVSATNFLQYSTAYLYGIKNS